MVEIRAKLALIRAEPPMTRDMSVRYRPLCIGLKEEHTSRPMSRRFRDQKAFINQKVFGHSSVIHFK